MEKAKECVWGLCGRNHSESCYFQGVVCECINGPTNALKCLKEKIKCVWEVGTTDLTELVLFLFHTFAAIKARGPMDHGACMPVPGQPNNLILKYLNTNSNNK